MGRLWAYLVSLMRGGLDNLESPEQLLRDAQTEMREQQARNRARAVEAVTMKNNLRQQVNDMKRRIDSINAKADEAEAHGDSEAAHKLHRERDAYQKSLTTMEESLIEAEAMTEQMKKAIQYEEETIRRKTAEALELKAQWKNSHIYTQMQKDLHLMDEAGRNPNRANDPVLRWLLATYGFILLLLLIVLLIVRAGR